MRQRLLVALVAALALGLAACGGGSSSSSSNGSSSGSASSGSQSSTPAKPAAPAPSASSAANAALSHKPAIPKPIGPPPTTLVVRDLIPGTGQAAKPGDSLTVQYVGANYLTGRQFDASWDRGQPFTFQLGGGQVIPGWDKGIAGMKVGGRRELVIPPALGYGAQGQPPTIQPNETLVFVIDLEKAGR